MKQSEYKELIQKQIKQTNTELEKELGMKLNKKVWDLINTLIIKVNQYYQVNLDMIEQRLTKVYADNNIDDLRHIQKENKVNE